MRKQPPFGAAAGAAASGFRGASERAGQAVIDDAIQLGWHARYGNIFQHAHTDRVLVPAVAILAGILMAIAWIELYRELTRVRQAA